MTYIIKYLMAELGLEVKSPNIQTSVPIFISRDSPWSKVNNELHNCVDLFSLTFGLIDQTDDIYRPPCS